MDQGIINPKSLALSKDDNNDPVAVMPTFYGDEYTDRSAYLSFGKFLITVYRRDIGTYETGTKTDFVAIERPNTVL